MSNMGYREIVGLDAQGLKALNDALRALWAKLMGGIEYRDLSPELRATIDKLTPPK